MEITLSVAFKYAGALREQRGMKACRQRPSSLPDNLLWLDDGTGIVCGYEAVRPTHLSYETHERLAVTAQYAPPSAVGGQAPRVALLELGRDPAGSDVAIPFKLRRRGGGGNDGGDAGPLLSRRHCAIGLRLSAWDDGRLELLVLDYGSANGTFTSGLRVPRHDGAGRAISVPLSGDLLGGQEPALAISFGAGGSRERIGAEDVRLSLRVFVKLLGGPGSAHWLAGVRVPRTVPLVDSAEAKSHTNNTTTNNNISYRNEEEEVHVGADTLMRTALSDHRSYQADGLHRRPLHAAAIPPAKEDEEEAVSYVEETLAMVRASTAPLSAIRIEDTQEDEERGVVGEREGEGEEESAVFVKSGRGTVLGGHPPPLSQHKHVAATAGMAVEAETTVTHDGGEREGVEHDLVQMALAQSQDAKHPRGVLRRRPRDSEVSGEDRGEEEGEERGSSTAASACTISAASSPLEYNFDVCVPVADPTPAPSRAAATAGKGGSKRRKTVEARETIGLFLEELQREKHGGQRAPPQTGADNSTGDTARRLARQIKDGIALGAASAGYTSGGGAHHSGGSDDSGGEESQLTVLDVVRGQTQQSRSSTTAGGHLLAMLSGLERGTEEREACLQRLSTTSTAGLPSTRPSATLNPVFAQLPPLHDRDAEEGEGEGEGGSTLWIATQPRSGGKSDVDGLPHGNTMHSSNSATEAGRSHISSTVWSSMVLPTRRGAAATVPPRLTLQDPLAPGTPAISTTTPEARRALLSKPTNRIVNPYGSVERRAFPPFIAPEELCLALRPHQWTSVRAVWHALMEGEMEGASAVGDGLVQRALRTTGRRRSKAAKKGISATPSTGDDGSDLSDFISLPCSYHHHNQPQQQRRQGGSENVAMLSGGAVLAHGAGLGIGFTTLSLLYLLFLFWSVFQHNRACLAQMPQRLTTVCPLTGAVRGVRVILCAPPSALPRWEEELASWSARLPPALGNPFRVFVLSPQHQKSVQERQATIREWAAGGSEDAGAAGGIRGPVLLTSYTQLQAVLKDDGGGAEGGEAGRGDGSSTPPPRRRTTKYTIDSETFWKDEGSSSSSSVSPLEGQRSVSGADGHQKGGGSTLGEHDSCRNLILQCTTLLVADEVASCRGDCLKQFPETTLRLALTATLPLSRCFLYTPANTGGGGGAAAEGRERERLLRLLRFVAPGHLRTQADVFVNARDASTIVRASVPRLVIYRSVSEVLKGDALLSVPPVVEHTVVVDLSPVQLKMLTTLLHQRCHCSPRSFASRALLISSHCDLARDWLRAHGGDEGEKEWALPSLAVASVLEARDTQDLEESLNHSWRMRALMYLLSAALQRSEKIVVLAHSIQSLVLLGLYLQFFGFVDGTDFALLSSALSPQRRWDYARTFAAAGSDLCVLLCGYDASGVDFSGADRLIFYDTLDKACEATQCEVGALARALRLATLSARPAKTLYVNRLLSNEPVEVHRMWRSDGGELPSYCKGFLQQIRSLSAEDTPEGAEGGAAPRRQTRKTSTLTRKSFHVSFESQHAPRPSDRPRSPVPALAPPRQRRRTETATTTTTTTDSREGEIGMPSTERMLWFLNQASQERQRRQRADETTPAVADPALASAVGDCQGIVACVIPEQQRLSDAFLLL